MKHRAGISLETSPERCKNRGLGARVACGVSAGGIYWPNRKTGHAFIGSGVPGSERGFVPRGDMHSRGFMTTVTAEVVGHGSRCFAPWVTTTFTREKRFSLHHPGTQASTPTDTDGGCGTLVATFLSVGAVLFLNHSDPRDRRPSAGPAGCAVMHRHTQVINV